MNYISEVEKGLAREAKKNFLRDHPRDTLETTADTKKLENGAEFKPSTSVEQEVENFVK